MIEDFGDTNMNFTFFHEIFIVGIIIMTVYILVVWIYARKANKRRRELFQKRKPLDLQIESEYPYLGQEWIKTYTTILDVLCKKLNCKKEQIRFSDRFDRTLCFRGISFLGCGDFDDLDDLLEIISRKLEIPDRITNHYYKQFEKVQTIEDLCKCFYLLKYHYHADRYTDA